MNIPFSFVEDESVPAGTLIAFNMQTKIVPSGNGEPPTMLVVMDWEETAKRSFIITGIGGKDA